MRQQFQKVDSIDIIISNLTDKSDFGIDLPGQDILNLNHDLTDLLRMF